MFDDAASSTIEVVCHPRCGSVAIVKKGRSKNGEQRYLCQDCGRTFGMGGERILRTSKLPRETWMAHAECFVLMLPLRECARRRHVRLKTACTMRRRLIGCLSAYSPSFKVERDRGCELDKTYMEPFRGVSTKHLDAHLAWFKWRRTLMATDPGAAEGAVARQLANGVRRSRIRDMFNVLPPNMGYWVASAA